ncbi:MAG: hypothetical protein ACP5G1_00140 [Nanopusillaceae archaeon]
MEEELYATKYEVYMSLLISIIVFLIIFTTLSYQKNLDPKMIFISTLVMLVMIIVNIFTYLSYKGKIPLYRVRRK